MKPRIALPLVVAAIAVAVATVSLRGNAAAPAHGKVAAGTSEKAAAVKSDAKAAAKATAGVAAKAPPKGKVEKIVKTDAEWKKILTPEQYRVLREKGTEMAFTGKLYKEKRHGTYLCAGCGLELFSSDTKYESGSGWPSFWQPIEAGRIGEHTDASLGMTRDEVVCARCGGHLGHVFDDGPKPTGLRYCINSAALEFEEKK